MLQYENLKSLVTIQCLLSEFLRSPLAFMQGEICQQYCFLFVNDLSRMVVPPYM